MKVRKMKERVTVALVRAARRRARFAEAAREVVEFMRRPREADDYYVIPVHPGWVKILGLK